jgi:DNA polymerase-3 subunit alpha
MKNRLKKLKANVFDDLIAMVALYRPGPMEFIPHYIDRKFGIQEVSY